MDTYRYRLIGSAFAVAAAAFAGGVPVASAGTIFATGQLLTPGNPSLPPGTPGHDDRRDNFVYRIDTLTGVATPTSPSTTGLPAALAGTPDGRLLGFAGGRVGELNPFTGTFTPTGTANGVSATGLDVTHTGDGYIVPFSGTDRRLNRIDLATNAATPLGPEGAIGFALDAFYGDAAGTNHPFLIGLGSVARTRTVSGSPVVTSTLYGVHLGGGGKNNLVAINTANGFASVVGAANAVGTSEGGGFSGFAAMTGVDETGDGLYDTLYGNVNFSPTGGRLGGLARYDLSTGTFELVGTNPGVIFFGFASPIPEPATAGVLGLAGVGLLTRRRRAARTLAVPLMAVTTVAGASLPAIAAGPYEVVDLGNLGEYPTFANGLNDRNVVVDQSSTGQTVGQLTGGRPVQEKMTRDRPSRLPRAGKTSVMN